MRVMEAVQQNGRPKLFVCISYGRLGRGGATGFRVFGHYAASHEWNRVIEQAQWVRSRRPPGRNGASVLAHPVRVRVLEILNQRDMSPIEFCREGFAPETMDVSHVAYHFRELAEYGCLRVIEENKRRGSSEHVYP